MSGTEQTKDEKLSSQKSEEANMIQELMNVGMYEDGLSYNEMKDILAFISESKDMAKMETEGRALQRVVQRSSSKPPESASEISVKANSPHQLEAQENTYLSKPSVLYKVNRTSPIIFDQRSPEDSESPESSPSIFDKVPQNRYKHLDNKAIFDKLYKNTDGQDNQTQDLDKLQYNVSEGSSYESPNLHSTELKVEVQSKHNQKYERWLLNPLNISVDKKDVPLRQPARPIIRERVPFSFCNDGKALEMRDKVMIALNNHLEEIAKVGRNWQRTAVNSEFQWGSPIKVGIANGSLDKNPPREIKRILPGTQETNRETHERACKRKASTFDSEFIDDSNSDENYSFFVEKKKPLCAKVQSKLSTGTIEENLTYAGETSNLPNKNKTPEPSKNDNIADEFDNTNLRSLYNRNQKKKTEESVATITPSQLSRRIVVTLPKRKLYDLRQKRNNASRSNEKIIVSESYKEDNSIILNSNNENVLLSDQAIATELNKNDGDNCAIKVDNSVEIKPLPVKRIGKQFRRLKKLNEDKQIEKQYQQEEKRIKRNEVKIQKEFVQSQMQENYERKRIEPDEEELEMKEEKWKKIVRQREKKHKERERKIKDEEMKRLQEDKEEKRLLEVSKKEKEMLRNDDGNDIHQMIKHTNEIGSNTKSSVNCPICNRSFSIEDIQNHAAGCEQYDINDSDSNSNESPSQSNMIITNVVLPPRTLKLLKKCQICSTFSTDSGTDYKDHVLKCTERQKLSLKEARSSTSLIIDVPTSSIRSSLHISQQTHSELKYEIQFPSKDAQEILYYTIS